MSWVTILWRIATTVDRLVNSEDKTAKALSALTDRIIALESRVARLEAREEIVIVEAKAAAGVAAMMVFGDMSRRIGHLEARSDQRQLLPPS